MILSLTKVKSKLESITKQAEDIKSGYLPPESKEAKLWNLRKWYSFYQNKLKELENAPKATQDSLPLTTTTISKDPNLCVDSPTTHLDT